MDKLVSTIFLAFLGIHVLILPFDGVHCATKSSICNQTPYPEVCNSFLDSHTVGTVAVDETPLRVRESALGATLNQAQLAYSLVKGMDLSSFDQRAKSAWSDCLELYEDMISLMDQSIGSTDPVSSQTWLSAAITNHQTCQNGFNDFNLSSLLQSFPAVSGDFPKLLSNSLAINKAVAASSTAQVSDKQIRGRRLLGDGFPEWVSAGDRKLLQSTGSAVKADLVVAKDGSGNYRTITEAVAAAAKRSGSSRFVIHVKAGVYSENVKIKKSMKNLMFIGDGIDATVVTGNMNVKDGSTTFRSATFAVSGPGFIARDMTFQNTAGPQKHQAVAFRSDSDLSVFYSCSFKGYQDTLYLHTQRQFYRNCDIYGTVDFIFGNAAAVLQNCNIYVRKPMSNQKNTVTAQSRTDHNQNTGIIVHNSIVTAASDLKPAVGSFKSYLGRPWKQYSRTVFMKCSLDSLIDPAGWLPWSGNFALSTLYYGEYMNTGAGASTSGRVRWAGYHVITSAAEAAKFTVGNFLAGNSWIPATGVPFTAGL